MPAFDLHGTKHASGEPTHTLGDVNVHDHLKRCHFVKEYSSTENSLVLPAGTFGPSHSTTEQSRRILGSRDYL